MHTHAPIERGLRSVATRSGESMLKPTLLPFVGVFAMSDLERELYKARLIETLEIELELSPSAARTLFTVVADVKELERIWSLS